MTDLTPTPDKPKDDNTIELLSFRVGGQDYCVDIMSVREIRSSTKATSLPHSPPYMRGVINLRGTVLPIMDLSARLSIEAEAESDRTVIIVVAIGEQTVGLMVDAVSDILAIEESALQPPPDLPAETDTTFISALTIVDNRMIRVLDLTSVLPSSGKEAA